MNPLIQSRINALKNCAVDIASAFAAAARELEKQHAEKEALLQEQWRQRKTITTLNRLSVDFDALEAENEILRKQREALRASFESVLRHAKALGNLYKT